MKRVAPLLAVVLLAVAGVPPALADIYTVRRQGASIVPMKSEDISMDAEDVRIEAAEFGFVGTATFFMRNHADHVINSLVAFPIMGSPLRRPFDQTKDFQVHIRSADEPDSAFRPAVVERQSGKPRSDLDDYFASEPPKTIGDFPEIVVWNVTWAPQETKVIRVVLDMGEPMVVPGSNYLVAGWQWMYVVTTGSLWKGPIGRADISFKLGHPIVPSVPLPPYRQVSYPDQAKWQSDRLVTWHFENWTPTEEIWVRTVEWRGLSDKDASDYRFFLPVYRGAERAYSEATIEELVTRDLKLATEHLPAEVRSFDQNLLRIAIADWLLHEIYARRSDAFYLGQAADLPEPKVSYVEMDDHLYSSWYDLFKGYGYKGGWYQPDFSPNHRVKTSSLHPTEQKNVAFLRAYLNRLRREPAYEALRIRAHDPGEN